MPDLHFDILPAEQRTLWDVLLERAAFLRENDYYLAGGTALALQLGHRQSVDFDFFSQKPDRAAETQKELQKIPGYVTREIDRQTIHADVSGVKLSFIGNYVYPLLHGPLESQGIQIADILDIALMKLVAISHRATPRDYIDLAAILRSGHSLSDLLSASKQKYGDSFNTMIPLRALTSFDDLEGEMPILLDKSLASSWQEILRQAVRKVGSAR